ncbi:archease [Candidatus Uhrbacteria bacterium]|nr:archease [Candidatus Uhrbacteria bacterium]
MPFFILPHTADVRLKVWGKDYEEVFRAALLGMSAIQKKAIPTKDADFIERTISVEASDGTALLVDFLNEVLSLCAINKEWYFDGVFERLTATSLHVTLHGIAISDFDEDIKAVTYHEANLQKNEKGEWETIIVLDI